MATYYNSGYLATQRSNRVQDWANLILAIWLFISPWVLQFGAGANGEPVNAVSTAAWNAWVMGVLIFLVALSAIGRMELWQEWLSLIFGAWVFVSPWALGYTNLPAASWDQWIVGALVFLIALWSLGTMRTQTVTTTTTGTPTTRPPGSPPNNPGL